MRQAFFLLCVLAVELPGSDPGLVDRYRSWRGQLPYPGVVTNKYTYAGVIWATGMARIYRRLENGNR